MQIAGTETGITKEDWQLAIEKRAEHLYGQTSMTKEQRFSKTIGGNAHSVRGTVVDGGDELGKLFYDAMKHAPRAEPEPPPPPVDIAKAEASRRGSASVQMLNLAREHNKAFPGKTPE